MEKKISTPKTDRFTFSKKRCKNKSINDAFTFVFATVCCSCYSFVGRLGSVQAVSLNRQGCVKVGTVQHELLHVLGFDHEHCRSDRDHHIQVLIENIMTGGRHQPGEEGSSSQRCNSIDI